MARRSMRRIEWRWGRAGAITVALLVAWATQAGATFRYGPIQISGNLESQQLIRVDSGPGKDFQAFDLVQQRNTFRLQYEHDLVKAGKLLEQFTLPGVKKASFFAYYRLVYESIYHIAPGGILRAQDGSRAGRLSETRLSNGEVVRHFSGDARKELSLENVLREVFVDLELQQLPVSFRIGRQQIVWGNTVNFRALDNTNALDLRWHMQQEAGILGRVGFSELRIPAWAVKMMIKLPSMWEFSNNFIEAYDIPFEFNPTRASFLPRPWGLPVRNIFRGGLVVDALASQGAPNTLLIQPCFDMTRDIRFNSAAAADFSDTAETGLCPSTTIGRAPSKLSRGLYDHHDIKDVNQFGVRYGGTFNPLGLGFTFNYKYQRHVADATGGTALKSWGNFAANNAGSNPTSFIQFTAPGLASALLPGGQGHETCDPLTAQCTTVDGFLRVPVEAYYPYVSIFGLSLDYFDEFTSAVYNVEFAATKDAWIANANNIDSDRHGGRKAWEYEAAVLIDRPTWIRFLNPRSTFTTLVQGNLSVIPNREKVVCTGTPPFHDCTGGDLGLISNLSVPRLLRDNLKFDQRRKFEYLTIVAMQTFYWGGSLSPLVAWVSDWVNMPAHEWILTLQYLPTPNLILEPTLRVFWTNGRDVDDRYSVSRLAGRSELQVKLTYQF